MKILKEETYLVHAPYIHGEIFTVLCQHTFSDCSQPHLESNLLTTTSIFYRSSIFKKMDTYHVIPQVMQQVILNVEYLMLTLPREK
jgi:hypothetical protein